MVRLSADSGGGAPDNALVAGTHALSEQSASRLTKEAVEVVSEFHATNPLRPGMPKASLASRLETEAAVVDTLVEGSSQLRDDGATVAVEGFGGTLTSAQEQAWEELHATLRNAGLAVPRIKELGIDRELLHALVREDRVIRIGEELVYLPEQIEDIIGRLGELPDRFTVADFRDAYGFSRKYAVPLLEFLDVQRVTIREGDLRRVSERR